MNAKPVYKTGIYFLLEKGRVVYVGKTTRFPLRLTYHVQQCLPHDCVRFIKCEAAVLDRYEQRWIKRFKPLYNSAHKPIQKPSKVKVKITQAFKLKTSMKFRRLSKKSMIGFGQYRDHTVSKMIELGKSLDLASMYFKLSHISFLDDVLFEIGITSEWQIQKPGVNPDKFYEFGSAVFPIQVAAKKASIAKARKHTSREILKSINKNDHSKAYHQHFNQK